MWKYGVRNGFLSVFDDFRPFWEKIFLIFLTPGTPHCRQMVAGQPEPKSCCRPEPCLQFGSIAAHFWFGTHYQWFWATCSPFGGTWVIDPHGCGMHSKKNEKNEAESHNSLAKRPFSGQIQAEMPSINVKGGWKKHYLASSYIGLMIYWIKIFLVGLTQISGFRRTQFHFFEPTPLACWNPKMDRRGR